MEGAGPRTYSAKPVTFRALPKRSANSAKPKRLRAYSESTLATVVRSKKRPRPRLRTALTALGVSGVVRSRSRSSPQEFGLAILVYDSSGSKSDSIARRSDWLR